MNDFGKPLYKRDMEINPGTHIFILSRTPDRPDTKDPEMFFFPNAEFFAIAMSIRNINPEEWEFMTNNTAKLYVERKLPGFKKLDELLKQSVFGDFRSYNEFLKGLL